MDFLKSYILIAKNYPSILDDDHPQWIVVNTLLYKMTFDSSGLPNPSILLHWCECPRYARLLHSFLFLKFYAKNHCIHMYTTRNLNQYLSNRQYTVMEICLHTKASVWGKTSLNTGGAPWCGRGRADPPTCNKIGIFLLMSLTLFNWANFHQFPIKWSKNVLRFFLRKFFNVI